MHTPIFTRRLWVFTRVAIALCSPVVAQAQPAAQKPPSVSTKYLVVFLPNSDNVPQEKQILGFKDAQITGGNIKCDQLPEASPPVYTITMVKSLLECAADNANLFTGGKASSLGASIANRTEAAAIALRLLEEKRENSSKRAFAAKNQGILAVAFIKAVETTIEKMPVIVDGPKGQFSFEETPRESQLSTDLQDLASVALGLARAGGGEVPDKPVDKPPLDVTWMESSLHVQTETRSDIKVTHKVVKASAQLASNYTPEALARWRFRLDEAQATALQDQTKCDDILKPKPSDPNGSPEEIGRRQDAVAIAACQLKYGKTDAEKIAAAEALGRRGSVTTTILLRLALAADTSSEILRAAIVRALGGSDSSQAAPRSAAQSGGDSAAAARTVTLASGEQEHWFLSADVMLSDDLKFGTTDKGTPTLAGKPPTFYVGANYVVGDLLTLDRPVWQSIFLKAFVKGSKRPQESAGIAVGVRGKYFNWPALNFEGFSPFVAVTWTRHEEAGVITHPHAGRVGVAVNLDKAIGWLK